MRTAKQVFTTTREKLTEKHAEEIIMNLYNYNKEVALAWFVGMGWPEGYSYCQNISYLRLTAIPIFLEKHYRALWFACIFLDK